MQTGTQPCPVAHNSGTGPGLGDYLPDEGASLSFAGRVVECRGHYSALEPIGGGVRGRVAAWSAASRRRFLYNMAALDFDYFLRSWGGRFAFVTLTYRHDPGPVECKRHLDVLRRSLRDYFGEAPRWAWKMEFQRRGVVHFHVLLHVPDASDASLVRLRAWTWNTWERITGGRHRVDVGWCRAKDVARYIAFDLTKGGKGYQFKATAAWGDYTGRWWAINGLPAFWSHAQMGVGELVAVRRLLRRYRRANSRTRPKFGHSRLFTRMWVIGAHSGSLMAKVDRFLQDRAPPAEVST